jgi:hypothetical protein
VKKVFAFLNHHGQGIRPPLNIKIGIFTVILLAPTVAFGKIVFYSGFETGRINRDAWSTSDDSWDWKGKSCEGEDGRDYPIEVVRQGQMGSPSPRVGNYMVRFETRKGDTCASKNYRNTMYNLTFLKTCQERWVGYSIYVPDTWRNNNNHCGAMFGGGTEGQRDGLKQYNHSARLGLRNVASQCGGRPPVQSFEFASWKYFDQSKYYNKWVDIVLHFDTSTTQCGDKGFYEGWIDGQYFGKRTGNVHSLESKDAPPGLTMDYKLGPYLTELSDGSPLIFWADEIRVGDANSSYAEVDPAQGASSLPIQVSPPSKPTGVHLSLQSQMLKGDPKGTGSTASSGGSIASSGAGASNNTAGGGAVSSGGAGIASGAGGGSTASSGGSGTSSGAGMDNIASQIFDGSENWNGMKTISAGGTYSGSWESNDPEVPTVRIATSQPVIIENANIRGKGDLIVVEAKGADVTIRNSKALGLNPNKQGAQHGFFYLDKKGMKKLVVENNRVEQNLGILVKDCQANSQVKIRYNFFKNLMGQPSDGKGGYIPGSKKELRSRATHAFQADMCYSFVNSEIAWNYTLNEPFKSVAADNFNLHRSGGTATSWFLIHDNFIDGGYPWALDDRYNGGGIVADGTQISGSPAVTESTVPRYIKIYDNQIIRIVANGVGLAAGNNLEAYGNRILSSNKGEDGRLWTGGSPIGFYAYPWKADVKPYYFNVSAYDNEVGFYDPQKKIRNDYYVPGCDKKCQNNKSIPDPITWEMEQLEYERWNAKLAQKAIAIGPK